MKNCLKLYDFILLFEDEQYRLTFTQGIFLVSVQKDNRTFALYSLEMFYVEVEYDIKTNSIKRHTAFLGGQLIDKYINFNCDL